METKSKSVAGMATDRNKNRYGTPMSQPKRERYNWTTKDKPGEFDMIDKTQLYVDSSYQRKISELKTNKIASSWSWVACGAISVVLREADCRWYVIDGQHRVVAAMKRDDIKELPCLVFGLITVAEEAEGFLLSNTNRKPMTMVDRFRALLMTEDHAARVVNELVLSSGRTVASGSGSTYFTAVQIALQCVREDESAMRRVWPTIVELCHNNGEMQRITQPLIQGFWYLERHLAPEEESLGSSRWRKRVAETGYTVVVDAMKQAAAYHHTSLGLRICAIGLVNAINRRLRSGKLQHSISGSQEEVEAE